MHSSKLHDKKLSQLIQKLLRALPGIMIQVVIPLFKGDGMEETFMLELTRGELGILLRHVRMDKKNDEIARKFIALAAPEVAREIDEVLDLKNYALTRLIQRVKEKAYVVGDFDKIKEYDQILKQHMDSKALTPTIQKHCEELFHDFIRSDANINAALISHEERDAHLKFFDIAERVLKS